MTPSWPTAPARHHTRPEHRFFDLCTTFCARKDELFLQLTLELLQYAEEELPRRKSAKQHRHVRRPHPALARRAPLAERRTIGECRRREIQGCPGGRIPGHRSARNPRSFTASSAAVHITSTTLATRSRRSTASGARTFLPTWRRRRASNTITDSIPTGVRNRRWSKRSTCSSGKRRSRSCCRALGMKRCGRMTEPQFPLLTGGGVEVGDSAPIHPVPSTERGQADERRPSRRPSSVTLFRAKSRA